MQALSTHLRDPDTHARLAFHPGCPICRSERLSGRLTSTPLVSQRARAAVATGVLVVATVSPAAAFAVEPDTSRDGTADASQHAPGDAPDSPDGGASGGSQDVGDNEPVGEPASDTLDPDDDAVVDPVGGLVAPNPRSQPAPPAVQSPTPPAVPTAGAASPDVSTAPPASEPTPAQAPELTTMVASAAASGQPVLTVRAHALKRATKAHAIATSQPVAAAAPAPAPSPATQSADAADPGDRAHTVHAGESLWSIASDRLGPGAGPAQIAREVHRLWQLNADRIGTGDPDLLMIGTRLRLR